MDRLNKGTLSRNFLRGNGKVIKSSYRHATCAPYLSLPLHHDKRH